MIMMIDQVYRGLNELGLQWSDHSRWFIYILYAHFSMLSPVRSFRPYHGSVNGLFINFSCRNVAEHLFTLRRLPLCCRSLVHIYGDIEFAGGSIYIPTIILVCYHPASVIGSFKLKVNIVFGHEACSVLIGRWNFSN